MYHSVLTAAFFVVLVVLVYRKRQVLCPLLPGFIVSRLPSLDSSSTHLALSATPSSSSDSLLSRLFSRVSSRPQYLPLAGSSWSANLSNGLSSSLFDITANIHASDPRSGLDPSGAHDIQTIMATQRVTFDQATLIRHKQILVQNNIDPNTGLPLDSKAVTSLGATSRSVAPSTN